MIRTEAADNLHAMKYRAPNEDFREAMQRLAFGLQDDDNHYHLLREILLEQRFLPGGRIQSSIGSVKQTTAFNCYVSGTIADSFTDGNGSIMERAKEAAKTMRMGGGIGYDFSTIRPRGSLVQTLQTIASGPVSFMDIYNSVCKSTYSSGHRAGAQMAVLRVDHPDINEFIMSKHNNDKLTGFNISVAITDEFMEAALNNKPFDLRFGNRVTQTIDAADLWERIMRSTWDYAEPGVMFVDTVNRLNNLRYCETIYTTNPCGEQPLPPFGACLLGSFNLVKYLLTDIVTGEYLIDKDQLRHDIPIIVRAMDNVTDRTKYPLAEQRGEAISKRRMGLGVTGLANCLEALGHSYGSASFLEKEAEILAVIRDECYIASAMLAKEKGSFPLFDAERLLEKGTFASELPEHITSLIKSYGLRNSHLTSIAPTGTISMAADNVSSSIEPVFAYMTQRPINTPTGPKIVTVEDYGYKFLNTHGKLAADVTADEHVNVLLTGQKYVDSAVSKTINMDGRKMAWPDFKDIYRRAWEGGAKGCTTFNISGLRMTLLSDAASNSAKSKEGTACFVKPDGTRSCE